ncbi:PucR family transcriptional regulator [Nocardia colli]|uniref:PucR family transcriptional regulator n=1 Tax=Nocardia colli TaxID=2545717 RepID=UPI0035D92593
MDTPSHQDALGKLQDRASALLDAYSADSPLYQGIPQSVVDVDFVPAIRLNLALLFTYLRDGVEPSEADTSSMVERAREVLRDGMSLDVVLRNYRFGVAFVWSQLLNSATAAERAAMLDAAVPLAQYLSIVTTRVALGCFPHTPDPQWEELERRRGMADALLAGEDPVEWAHDPAISVADAFLVTVLRAGDPSPGTMTALRNRVHEIPGAFVRMDSGGWTALTPIAPDDDGTAAATRMSALLTAAAPAQGPPTFWVGVSPARSRTDIPAAHAEAQVLGELGRCLSRPDIVGRRAALLLEYTIAVSGSACARLAATLDPLDDQPLLAETLDSFLAHGFNQLATGRELNVHRNTVTYRLTRIHELTGLDPQHPADVVTLSAARIAQRLEAASFTVHA